MNRAPSTTVALPRSFRKHLPIPAKNREAYQRLFAAARDAHKPEINGLICADESGRAFFQITGDPIPYSVLLAADELALFPSLPRKGDAS